MTTEDGEYALRNRNDWGGRRSVDEPGPGGGDGSAAGRSDGTATDGGRRPGARGDE